MKVKQDKNICYVLKYFPQPSETFITDEAISLLQFGVNPFIIYLNDGDTSIVHPSARKLIDWGVARKTCSFGRASSLRSWFGIFYQKPWLAIRGMALALFADDRWRYFQALKDAEWCLARSISFLHAHFADTNFIYTRILSFWTGIPYGVTTHRYDLLEDPIPYKEAIRCYTQAHLIVTISEFNRNLMVHKYELPYDRINIIHCGIDIERFSFKSSNNQKSTQSPLRIVNVGRLVPVKGQGLLLNALALAKKRGINFQLNIIGAGAMYDELLELARHLQIEDSVLFSGAQSQPDVVKALQVADLFVLPSLSEGLPVACMETMAIGTPIIATRISGIPELIENNVTGLLVEPGSAQQLADAICWVQNNQPHLPRMSLAARQKVEAEFDRTTCSSQLLHAMKLFSGKNQ